MCSKYVEAGNKTYCEKFYASRWLNTEINFLICYVYLVLLFIPTADLISPNTHIILIDFSIVY